MDRLTMDVIDVGADPEPPYWAALRGRAGLRADWSYDLLRLAAAESPATLLVSVLRLGSAPVGVVAAAWTGLAGRGRRRRPARRPLAGVLDVRSPGTSAVPGWWFAEELPEEPRRELFAQYVRRMRVELGPRCRGVLWRQVVPELVPAARRGGPVRIARRFSPCAVLSLTWASEAEWLASLRRGRRKSLRSRGRQIDADPGLTVAVGAGHRLDPAEVSALIGRTEQRYGPEPWSVPAPASPDYLRALMASEEVLTVSYTDATGRLVAFGTVLDHPSWPVSRHWGALPPEAGGRNLWFDRYLRVIGWAIRRGKSGLIMGKGKPHLKAELGGVLVPQYAVAVGVW